MLEELDTPIKKECDVFGFDFYQPSPPTRDAKYRVDDGARKILPVHMNHAMALIMQRSSSSPTGRMCVIQLSQGLEDGDVTDALQKVQVT